MRDECNGELQKPWLPNLARHELTLKLWEEYFQL